MLRVELNESNYSTLTSERCVKEQFLISAALQDFDRVRHFVEVEGLHPDTTIEGKPTAICYAALKRDRCLLQYLHIKGASANIKDKMGMTPLHYAVLGGCTFCVSYLIHSGASVNQPSLTGKTPLALTIGSSHLQECKKLLMRHGGRVFSFSQEVAQLH